MIAKKSYKIRKSGNSNVMTIPKEMMEKLEVETGGAISYIILSDGSVKLEKGKKEVDIDSIVDSVMNQYEKAIKDLIDL